MQQTQASQKDQDLIRKNKDGDENATSDVGGWRRVGRVNTLSVSIIRERLTFDHTVDYDHGGVQQDQDLYQLLYKHTQTHSLKNSVIVIVKLNIY